MKPTDAPSGSPGSAKSVPDELQMLQKSNKNSGKTPLAERIKQVGRFDHFSRAQRGLLLDFSRVDLDEDNLARLIGLAEACGLASARARLFAGEPVNTTEHRAAMHMALRMPTLLDQVPPEDAEQVHDTARRMRALADRLHQGRLPADPEQCITDIVHVGIGGSLLGPQLICEALPSGGEQTPKVHFLGSVDAGPRESLLPQLRPESTLVILASKSFSTPDTLMHGQRLLDWLRRAVGDQAAAQRLVVVTAATGRAVQFGALAEQVLFLPEWVGGRYSLWSAVSLVAAARSGTSAFDAMLAGAAEMDRHFIEAPAGDNLPILLGLLGAWHRNICGYPAWGVIPYDQRLRLLPAHLQQLIMESNGKSVRLNGEPVDMGTAPLVFGECGTDAQHSLFQALHQGTDVAPLHFIGVIRPAHDDTDAHAELLANLLAQATALATGRSAEETRSLGQDAAGADERLLAHRTFEGNRPSEVLMIDELTPGALGALLALYEHKVFVESVIWNVNAFDQWGVELGKTLTPGIRRALSGDDEPVQSLAGLVAYIRSRS